MVGSVGDEKRRGERCEDEKGILIQFALSRFLLRVKDTEEELKITMDFFLL